MATSEDLIRFGVVPAHGPQHLATAIEQVRQCKAYGFDSIWIEEHHAAGPYWPTPFLAIAALAPHLDGLMIGTDILILPLHDPVEVAEQAAVIDQLTAGRFVLGVGLGDSPVEFAAFRVPANQRGARFEEQLLIIRALWRGETVSHRGRFYELKSVRLETEPKQVGGPPIWIGGWGPLQLSRAANIGNAWFPGPVGSMTEVNELLTRYDQLVLEKGEDPLSRSRPITRDVVIASDRAEAWELANQSVLHGYRDTYLEGDHPLVGKGSGVAFADLQDMARDRLVIGNPQEVAAQIARCIVRLQANHVILRLKLPGVEPGDITHMIDLLGRDVLPKLREACRNESSLKQLAALAVA